MYIYIYYSQSFLCPNLASQPLKYKQISKRIHMIYLSHIKVVPPVIFPGALFFVLHSFFILQLVFHVKEKRCF